MTPEIEPWMIRAATDILAEDWDDVLEKLRQSCDGRRELAVRPMIKQCAAIMARHCPYKKLDHANPPRPLPADWYE